MTYIEKEKRGLGKKEIERSAEPHRPRYGVCKHPQTGLPPPPPSIFISEEAHVTLAG